MLRAPGYRRPLLSVSATYAKYTCRGSALTSLFRGGGLGKLVEYMEVPLAFDLSNDASFFEQVIRDLRADGFSVVIEHDFQVLSLCGGGVNPETTLSGRLTYMATAVIVPQSLRTAETLQ